MFRIIAFVGLLASLFATSIAVAVSTETIESRALSVTDIINAFGVGLVKDVNVDIPLSALTDNLVNINFDIKNPLAIEITLDSVTASAGLNGTTLATFTHAFAKPGLVVPPLGTKNSGSINNVLLSAGIDAALAAVPFQVLDLPDTDAAVRAFTIVGFGGIPIPLNGLKQTNVPTVYTLDV